MNIALASEPIAASKSLQTDSDVVNAHLKTFVINLDRAEQRWRAMTARLAHLGLAYERLPAIDGSLLRFPTPAYDEPGYRLRHGKRTNPAEVGCYLSHIECARRLLETDAPHALILEDDLEFPEDFCELLVSALDAKKDWDILRLSTVNRGRKFAVRKITAHRSLAISLTREKGSGAYIINRRAARWLIEREMPMCLPYDIAYDLEFLAGLRAVFVTPVPVNQAAPFPSQIQNDLYRYRISSWLRGTVYLYRASLEIGRLFCRLYRLSQFKCRTKK